MSTTTEARQRLAELFRELSPVVYAYARRRIDAATAHDVTAETFLVAWRRVDEVPAEPLPWLLGVARNILRNQARAHVRRDRLFASLAREPGSTGGDEPGADVDVLERTQLAEALTRLTDREREALLLTAWEGLSPADAATVTGCSTTAFAARLSRARSRLSAQLDAASPDPPTGAHSPVTVPTPSTTTAVRSPR